MKELKVRIYDKTQKRMIYSGSTPPMLHQFFLDTATLNTVGKSEYQVHNNLNDKNGKEIYEGDFIKTIALDNDNHQRGAITTFIIRWWMGNSCLCFFGAESGIPIYPYNVNHTIEIIGNLDETPELLKR